MPFRSVGDQEVAFFGMGLWLFEERSLNITHSKKKRREREKFAVTRKPIISP